MSDALRYRNLSKIIIFHISFPVWIFLLSCVLLFCPRVLSLSGHDIKRSVVSSLSFPPSRFHSPSSVSSSATNRHVENTPTHARRCRRRRHRGHRSGPDERHQHPGAEDMAAIRHPLHRQLELPDHHVDHDLPPRRDTRDSRDATYDPREHQHRKRWRAGCHGRRVADMVTDIGYLHEEGQLQCRYLCPLLDVYRHGSRPEHGYIYRHEDPDGLYGDILHGGGTDYHC